MEVESEGAEANVVTGETNGRKPTFKEKVLGKACVDASAKKVFNLVDAGIMKLELLKGNRLFPKFSIDAKAYEEICQPWENCLVVKLLGKHIGYGALCDKLRFMWKLNGGYEVRDVNHGYFLIKFDLDEDREKVLAGTPWLIYDHYLFVKPWTKDFVAADSKISTTTVWIRIPGLGFQFYDESVLLTLATAVGTPIKVDMNTKDMQRGKFARICVEIDLMLPVVGKLCLRDTWYNIEYEG